MKKLSQKMLTGLVLGSLMACGTAFAAEVTTPEFELDQIIVTATRTEKRDVDVPASTEVLTAEQIKASGATNAQTALQKATGITYASFGQDGASMGTMSNDVVIRGVDTGTLVLVDGAPAAWRGKYNLAAIPAEIIERIEVVKGSGSVLYGSEAAAGVINVITKKKGYNSITAGIGNFGQKKYGINVGNEKFKVHYNKTKWDHVVRNVQKSSAIASAKDIANTNTNVDDIRRENFGFAYNISDQLTASYNYLETQAFYGRYINEIGSIGASKGYVLGEQYNGRLYTTKQHLGQLKFDNGTTKARIYINDGTVESDGPTLMSSSSGSRTPTGYYNTRERNQTLGGEIQQTFKVSDKIEAILGVDYKHETYQALPALSTTDTKDASRNVWGIFGQWDQKFDDKNEMIISARETMTKNASYNRDDYSNFSAAGQFIHKLTKDSSVYASVAQSFVMPTFASLYSTTDTQVANPDLKPQKGINYEIGWKAVTDKHTWKAAFYDVRIKDNISASYTKSTKIWKYTNEDYKNLGFELSHSIQSDKGLHFKYGINIQNPKSKPNTKTYWDRKYGRVQLNGGIGYTSNKFNIDLEGTYLCDRVQTPSNEHSFDVKPYLLTTLTTTYSPDKNNEFSLVVNNLLDRDDVTSHSTSAYRYTPANFLLSYTYKF